MENVNQFEEQIAFDGLSSGFYNMWIFNIKFLITEYNNKGDSGSISKAECLTELLSQMDNQIPSWNSNIEEMEHNLYTFAENNKELIENIEQRLNSIQT